MEEAVSEAQKIGGGGGGMPPDFLVIDTPPPPPFVDLPQTLGW